MNPERAERDLDESIRIHAAPDRVWSLLIDPRTMTQASPELFATTRRRRGPLRAGETFVGWNRNGLALWPTVNTVTTFDIGREIAWHTRSSGAVWTYTLTADGDRTVLRERRQMPDGASATARLFARVLLGGIERHTDELSEHVSATLAWIKTAAEDAPGDGRPE